MSTSVLVRLRRQLTLSACAGALALGLAACGGGGDKDPDPAQAVPASVPVYAQVTIRPDGDLEKTVADVSQRLFGSRDVSALIDKQITASGGKDTIASGATDWVGSRLGAFLSGASTTSADGAVVIAIADQDAAKKSMEEGTKGETKKSYKDVDYFVDKDAPTEVSGIVGDYAVVGTDRGMKIVIDTVKGGSDVDKIGDAKKYTDALASVGDTKNALATVYANPQGLVETFARSGGIPTSALAGVRQSLTQAGSGWAAKFGVGENALAIDFAATGVKQSTGTAAVAGAATKALQALPGDAWLGVGTGAIGATLRSALQQGLQAASLAGDDVQSQLSAIEQQLGINLDDDLLSWMGDAGLFASGTAITNLGGALVVQSSSPAKTKVAIAKLRKLIPEFAPGVKVKAAPGLKGADTAVQIISPSVPLPIYMAVGGDRFVLGIGQAAVESGLSPKTTLAASPSYKQAAAALDGVDPTFFLDVAPISTLLKGLGLDSDPDSAKVLTALEKVGSVSAGTKTTGTTVHAKIVLTLPE